MTAIRLENLKFLMYLCSCVSTICTVPCYLNEAQSSSIEMKRFPKTGTSSRAIVEKFNFNGPPRLGLGFEDEAGVLILLRMFDMVELFVP